MREFTQAEADQHNALTAKGWALIKGRLALHEQLPTGPPGWFTRLQLRRAITCFEKALTINPEGWSAMWALGKIYQRLGQNETALDWFARAHAINPTQADVAREGGLAAMDCGRVEEAIELCQAAVANRPEEPGLICNLALAHCLAGQDAEAERCAAAAVQRDPSDGISATVLGFVRDVAAGKRVRPKRLCEAFPNG